MMRVLCLFLCLLIHSSTIFAGLTLNEDFPISPDIAKKVAFWERIFLKYPSTSTVIHDLDHSDLLIDVIDFEAMARREKVPYISSGKKNKITNAYVDRYILAIKRFQKLGKSAVKYGAIEERVWQIYSRNPNTLEDLYQAKTRIRSQGGLSDVFIQAAYKAQFYLPYMEEVFRKHGVPPVITRLPFVESMFNLDAKSKTGAYGIWQFMPATARNVLKMNTVVDERRSPFKATRAAAKYLSNGHKQLQSWPLAVVGYNYGVNGMLRAVNSLNTRNIDAIIGNYRSPAFQYASKNFYAEFLAAVLVYNHLTQKGKIRQNPQQANVKSFILTESLSIQELVVASGIEKELFKKYNACIRDSAFNKAHTYRLPVPFEIFLPGNKAQTAQSKLSKYLSLSSSSKRNL